MSRNPKTLTANFAGTFFSALTREVEGLSLKSAPVAGWNQTLLGLVKAGRVKQDEIEWSGLQDWLQLQAGKVAKEDALAFLGSHGVQVQEMVLGSPDYAEVQAWWVDEGGANEEVPFSELTEAEQREAAERYADEVGRHCEGCQAATYAQHTLPGADNYREVLLTLPGKSTDALDVRIREISNWPRNTTTAKRPEDQAELDRLCREWNVIDSVPKYKSSHWDALNVLAHIRLNDRTDADGGRVLFVEEIQSDWGQQGRKHGFRQGLSGLAPSEESRFQLLLEDGRRNLRGDDLVDFEGLLARRNAAADDRQRIAPGPFVDKTHKWLNLALKRVIKMAVDGGYEKVAFITGQQGVDLNQVKRSVDYIDYVREGPDKFRVACVDKYGQDIDLPKEAMGSHDLERYVGENLAQRIISGEGERGGGRMTLRRLDVQIGGEGMRAFYDKIVPAALDDLLAKNGSKREIFGLSNRAEDFEWADLENATDEEREGLEANGQIIGLQQPGFVITEEMRAKVSGGFPLFSYASRAPVGENCPNDEPSTVLRERAR